MANAVDIVKPLKWGSFELPSSGIQTTFGNMLAQREWAYVDGEGHIPTGAKSDKYHASIYFLNTVEPGLYPGKLREFLAAARTGKVLKLRHPDRGDVPCRIEDGDYTTTSESPAGVVLSVTWTETRVTLDATAPQNAIASSDGQTAAAQADAAMAQLNIPYPDGTGATSLTEAFLAIASTIQLTPQFYEGQVNAILGAIDHIEDRYIDSLKSAATLPQPEKDAIVNDPAGWVLYQSLYILRDSLTQQSEQVKKQARPTASASVESTTTLSALASKYDNTIDDLIALNGTLTAAPFVPKGSKVSYYTSN